MPVDKLNLRIAFQRRSNASITHKNFSAIFEKSIVLVKNGLVNFVPSLSKSKSIMIRINKSRNCEITLNLLDLRLVST